MSLVFEPSAPPEAAPELDVDPELEDAPELDVDPELEDAPELDVDPELEDAPELDELRGRFSS